MDISNPLNQLVDSLQQQILDNVQSQVERTLHVVIAQKLAELDIAGLVEVAVSNLTQLAIDKYTPDTGIIDRKLADVADDVVRAVDTRAVSMINETIVARVQNTDFDSAVVNAIQSIVEPKLQKFDFPAKSIPFDAVNFNGIVSGNHIKGGIIKDFGSTGIDDKATDCRVTILDDHTVFENTLLAPSLNVKGDTVLEGIVKINGAFDTESPGFENIVNAAELRVKQSIDGKLFDGFSEVVFNKIQEQGIDLTRVTVAGEEILFGNRLGNFIVDSNLQQLGVLKELQVQGETLLDNTVYVANGRVGINTLEPGATFSVWDNEVEVQIQKRKKDTAFIGCPRPHSLVLSSNNKDNIVLQPDGSVTVKQLNVGLVSIGAADSAPAYDAPKGTILFNSNPTLGGPLGWVSLGDAKWANFGIID